MYIKCHFFFSINLYNMPVSSDPLISLCLWYLPIPRPQKGTVVEEYQHWLQIKLMDSLPNSYSIYFPPGIPSVSFPLSLLNFLYSVFHSHSAFFCPCFPSCFPFSPLISCPFFSVPRWHLPTLTKPHPGSPSLCYVLSLFSHLIQCGLAHREVFDLQSILVGLQLVKDVSHPSWSKRYVVLHHIGVLVLCVGKKTQ